MKAYEAYVFYCKRLKKCVKEVLDEDLLKDFVQQRNSCLPITGPITKIQAETFAAQLGYTHFHVLMDGYIVSSNVTTSFQDK